MGFSKHLNISLQNSGLLKIIFNKPKKKNAIDGEMYMAITSLLKESATNPDVKVTVFSGIGDYFTSGNDLTNYSMGNDINGNDAVTMDELLENARHHFKEFVDVFIDYPKPLIAVVNGPAVGIGVTILAHFDLVFASSSATFHSPFVAGGLSPEGCSSFLFPLLMGHAKAADMLLFGKKISAHEAQERNLVSEVVEPDSMHSVWKRIESFTALPPNTLLNAKSIMKKRLRSQLHKINEEECDALSIQWKSEEFLQQMMRFLTQSKL